MLWFVAKLYALVGGANDGANGWTMLRTVVKLPAIAMDLVNAGVVYLIVRRYAAEKTALVAAAVLALNPAAIYVSAYWGQVDSVSWGLVLVALLLVLRAGDEPGKTVPRLTLAWLAFAFSILIKPQGTTLGLLFLAYPFATTDAAVRARRLAGTGAGIVAALALALVVGLLFHPERRRVRLAVGALHVRQRRVRVQLRQRVQPVRAAPAVLAIRRAADGHLRHRSSARSRCGASALVVAATLLIVGRYLQRRDDRALLEAALLCALAFFVLATRMHERYVYGAFLFAVPLIAFGRIGGWSSFVLTVTMYLNLAYSLAYQTRDGGERRRASTPPNLWPLVSHPAALANVAAVLLRSAISISAARRRRGAPPSALDRALPRSSRKARGWFDPREGIVGMTRRDWMFAGGIALGAFVIAVIGLAWPPEKIFDEVYFARGGEEYLRGVTQYEWTHPPFTKLVIALSIAISGGLHGAGDTSFGWRFLNVVIGSLRCVVIYAFAKRLTGQTWLAALARRAARVRRLPLRRRADRDGRDHHRDARADRALRALPLRAGRADSRHADRPGRGSGARSGSRWPAARAVAAVLARLVNIAPAHRNAEIVAGIAHGRSEHDDVRRRVRLLRAGRVPARALDRLARRARGQRRVVRRRHGRHDGRARARDGRAAGRERSAGAHASASTARAWKRTRRRPAARRSRRAASSPSTARPW